MRLANWKGKEMTQVLNSRALHKMKHVNLCIRPAHLYLEFLKSGKVCRDRDHTYPAEGLQNNSGSQCNGALQLLNCKLLPGGQTRVSGCMLQSMGQFGIASCIKVYPKPLYTS